MITAVYVFIQILVTGKEEKLILWRGTTSC